MVMYFLTLCVFERTDVILESVFPKSIITGVNNTYTEIGKVVSVCVRFQVLTAASLKMAVFWYGMRRVVW
jgi:hypothetical protein